MAASSVCWADCHVGLRFDHGFGNVGGGGGAEVGFGLVEPRLALGDAGVRSRFSSSSQELALPDMVAAIHEEFLHRRRDLRHHGGLVEREQDAVARDDAADGFLGDRRHLDGGGRFASFSSFLAQETRKRSGMSRRIF